MLYCNICYKHGSVKWSEWYQCLLITDVKAKFAKEIIRPILIFFDFNKIVNMIYHLSPSSSNITFQHSLQAMLVHNTGLALSCYCILDTCLYCQRGIPLLSILVMCNFICSRI